MPRYALLGATGATGTAVLECLLSEPPADLRLNILVRSKDKLTKLVPAIEERTPFPVEIFEGNVTDVPILERCLRGVEVVFVCVAENHSRPGLSLAADTANVIVDCLSNLRSQNPSQERKTTVMQLRTASLNPGLAAQVPRLVHLTVAFCLYYIYTDLTRACEVYQRAAEKDKLDYILVDPPTIHKDPQRTGYQLIDETQKQAVALSYADLGAAMCEIAVRRDEYRGKAVGVTATGQVRTNWGLLLSYLMIGLRGRMAELR